MATLKQIDYVGGSVSVNAGRDGIIVHKNLADIEGGRTLDLEEASPIAAYPIDYVPCGTPIITNGQQYKPVLPVAGSSSYAFPTLPEGYSYVGVCAATTKANRQCPIMTAGVVNEVALEAELKIAVEPKATTHKLDLSAVKSALTHIVFTKDEVYTA